MIVRHGLCALLLCLLACACGGKQLEVLDEEVYRLGRTVNSLDKQQAETRQEVEEDIQRIMAEVDQQADHLSQSQRNLEQSVQIVEDQLSSVGSARQLTAATGEDSPAQLPSSGEVQEEDEEFRLAYLSYSRGDFAAALQEFSDYLQRQPPGRHGVDARYWRAECLLRLERYEQAVESFQEVVEKYPKTDRAPQALYKYGICHLRLGQKDEARRIMQTLTTDYPQSLQAELAAETLRHLQKGE